MRLVKIESRNFFIGIFWGWKIEVLFKFFKKINKIN
jgi:hypothetical protein